MKYRIMTNGTWYKVQWRCLFVFWVDIHDLLFGSAEIPVPKLFTTKKGAEKYIKQINKKNIKENEWKPI